MVLELLPIIFINLVKTALTLISIVAVKLFLTKEILPDLSNTEQEKYYFTSSKREKKTKLKFPNLLAEEGTSSSSASSSSLSSSSPSSPPSSTFVDFSIVIPAYNEEDRIKICLDEIVDFFKSKPDTTFEIIIANDGSKDKTSEIALQYTDKLGHDINGLRLLELSKNRGKGGAVRKGVLAARGEYILMCDADGATKFSEIEKLVSCLVKKCKNGKFGRVAVGSRAHLAETSIAERTLLRTILMKGFHLLVQYIGNVHTIQDTQCGFKLFNRSSAKFLFSNLHIERWAFDVELLYACEAHGVGLGEVSVQWTEIEGSKLTPLTAAIQMARDLVLLRLYYIFGVYKFRYGSV